MKRMSTTYAGETAYTLKDISENSGIPVSRLRRHIQEGKLKGYEKSGTYGWIILQSQVIPYLAEYAKPEEQEMWERLEKEEEQPVEPLKVLSIDWDYFIKATNDERSIMFPDGGNENLSPYIQNVIWTSHYGSPAYNLEKIGVDREALKKIRFVLAIQQLWNKNVNRPSVMVTDSHKWAFDFISQHVKSSQQAIEVYNVDFHHDIYDICDTYDVTDNGVTGDSSINCGNWLRKLCENYEVKPHWIAREDSDPEADFQEPIPRATLDDLMNVQFDIIFICRSGMWSPPHLDIEFIRLVNPYTHKWVTSIDHNILKSRYTAEFKKTVESYKRQMREITKNMAGGVAGA